MIYAKFVPEIDIQILRHNKSLQNNIQIRWPISGPSNRRPFSYVLNRSPISVHTLILWIVAVNIQLIS